MLVIFHEFLFKKYKRNKNNIVDELSYFEFKELQKSYKIKVMWFRDEHQNFNTGSYKIRGEKSDIIKFMTTECGWLKSELEKYFKNKKYAFANLKEMSTFEIINT